MKRNHPPISPLSLIVLSLGVLSLSACYRDVPMPPPPPPPTVVPTDTMIIEEMPPTYSPNDPAQAGPTPAQPPPPADPAPTIPQPGIRVPGNPNQVFAPGDQGRVIDISGLPSGMEVRDPETGQIFLVP